MIRPVFKYLAVLLVLSMLTGCWSKFELIEWGFVQALAVDLNEDGLIQMTAHIYKPANGGGDQGGQMAPDTSSYMNVVTTGSSMFEAVRDISPKIGRKAQWSHMRAILIGEEAAKTIKIGDALDFFNRDHEPRDTVSIMFAKGRADRLLQQKPIIESTLGQQLKTIGEKGFSEAGKTLNVTTGDLFVRSRSEVTIAVIPVMSMQGQSAGSITVHGLSLVDMSDGKVVGTLPSRLVPYYLLLTNQYHNGVVGVPCSAAAQNEKKSTDVFEIVAGKSKVRPVVQGDSVQVKVQIELTGSIGELVCAPLVEKPQWEQFDQRLARAVTQNIQETLQLLQGEKADILGIGERLYRTHNNLWRRWKPDWADRFAECEFEVHVTAKVQNTGIDVGEPFSPVK